VVEKDFINSWEKILGPTLSIYLNELATLRCFWMQIQSGLDSE